MHSRTYIHYMQLDLNDANYIFKDSDTDFKIAKDLYLQNQH